jgi:hypothetical protein
VNLPAIHIGLDKKATKYLGVEIGCRNDACCASAGTARHDGTLWPWFARDFIWSSLHHQHTLHPLLQTALDAHTTAETTASRQLCLTHVTADHNGLFRWRRSWTEGHQAQPVCSCLARCAVSTSSLDPPCHSRRQLIPVCAVLNAAPSRSTMTVRLAHALRCSQLSAFRAASHHMAATDATFQASARISCYPTSGASSPIVEPTTPSVATCQRHTCPVGWIGTCRLCLPFPAAHAQLVDTTPPFVAGKGEKRSLSYQPVKVPGPGLWEYRGSRLHRGKGDMQQCSFLISCQI